MISAACNIIVDDHVSLTTKNLLHLINTEARPHGKDFRPSKLLIEKVQINAKDDMDELH